MKMNSYILHYHFPYEYIKSLQAFLKQKIRIQNRLQLYNDYLYKTTLNIHVSLMHLQSHHLENFCKGLYEEHLHYNP